jgi:hypothetical protein
MAGPWAKAGSKVPLRKGARREAVRRYGVDSKSLRHCRHKSEVVSSSKVSEEVVFKTVQTKTPYFVFWQEEKSNRTDRQFFGRHFVRNKKEIFY